MYSQILVPLDGSKAAEKALPLARYFARGARVELLGIVDITEMTRHIAAYHASMIPTMVDEATAKLSEYLDRLQKNFPVGTVRCTVRLGDAAETIIESAAAEEQMLIAMATHGRSGLGRWLLGSVAEKVLRGASNPVLLVRAQEGANPSWEMASMKRIIVALDGSKRAERILPHVEASAKHLDLAVTLIGVYGGPMAAGGSGDGVYNAGSMDAFIAGLRDETVRYLEGVNAELRQRGVEKVSFAAREGLAADEIISMAGEAPDTLIAMCTHGRSGIKRWMLGSVAETVVRHANSPTLIVRAS